MFALHNERAAIDFETQIYMGRIKLAVAAVAYEAAR
jgi:hypothetical protein